MIAGGLIVLGMAIKFLVTGRAGGRGHDFTPDNNPFGYWFLIALILGVAVFALVAGWKTLRRIR
jgi:hypothetical protein